MKLMVLDWSLGCYFAGTWEEHPGTQEVIIMQQQLREVSCDEESDFTSSDEHADQESSHSDGTENDDNETVTSNKFALLQEC